MRYAAATLCLALLFTASPAVADKAKFEEMKCNKCHTIDSLGVAQLKKKGDDDKSDAKEPVDLSKAGEHHDAAFYSKFLQKETEHVPHPGQDAKKHSKKHKKKWKGDDAELEQMVKFVTGLK